MQATKKRARKTPAKKRAIKTPAAKRGAKVFANPRPQPTVVEPDIAAIAEAIDGIQRTFNEFQTKNDERLVEIENRGSADVVVEEHVDRINASIAEQQTQIDEANEALAALQVGGTGAGGTADERQRAQNSVDFRAFMARGTRNGIMAAVQTDDDEAGGVAVTPEVERNISRVLGEATVMRRLASVLSISAAEYKKLVSLGGATSGWVAEREARAETSTPTLSALKFSAHEIYAMPGATQWALDDVDFNVEFWLADEIRTEFSEAEGTAYVTGDGDTQPRGFLDYNNVANASYEWGKIGYIASGTSGGFDTTNPGDEILDLIYALKSAHRQNAQFLTGTTTLATMRKFKDGDGNYMWQPSAQQGEPSLFMGYSVEEDDNMPILAANSLSLAFADWKRAYLIVDRVGTRVLRDPYTSKGNVLFYTTKRVGGGVQNYEAIKLMKFGTS